MSTINVRTVQQGLAMQGLPVQIDGIYGADTERFLQQFALSLGVPASGLVVIPTASSTVLDLRPDSIATVLRSFALSWLGRHPEAQREGIGEVWRNHVCIRNCGGGSSVPGGDLPSPDPETPEALPVIGPDLDEPITQGGKKGGTLLNVAIGGAALVGVLAVAMIAKKRRI